MVINPIVGVYIPIIRIPITGGMTIPNIATFDHGTHKSPIWVVSNNAKVWEFYGGSGFNSALFALAV